MTRLSQTQTLSPALSASSHTNTSREMNPLSQNSPQSLNPSHILQLQKMIGNQAVSKLLLQKQARQQDSNRKPIQRMIHTELPFVPEEELYDPNVVTKKKPLRHDQDWKRLLFYTYGQKINNRSQTFEEAVEEHLRLYDDQDLKNHWNRAKTMLTEQRLIEAHQELQLVKTQINDIQSKNVGHPNKVGISTGEELAQTIPQSQTSIDVATRLRQALVTAMKDDEVRNKLTETQKSKWKETFMIGVLVTPSGELFARSSGKFEVKQQQSIFERVCLSIGCKPLPFIKMHQKALTYLSTEDEVDQKALKKGNVKVGKQRGNPPGICAAPQLIGASEALGGTQISNSALVPDQDKDTLPLSLTEMFVSSDTTVRIPDAKGEEQKYGGDHDVPSCLTCQYQLRGMVADLVTAQRRIDGIESLKSDHREHQVWDQFENYKKRLIELESAVSKIPNGEELKQIQIEKDKLKIKIDSLETSIDSYLKKMTETNGAAWDSIDQKSEQPIPFTSTLLEDHTFLDTNHVSHQEFADEMTKVEQLAITASSVKDKEQSKPQAETTLPKIKTVKKKKKRYVKKTDKVNKDKKDKIDKNT